MQKILTLTCIALLGITPRASAGNVIVELDSSDGSSALTVLDADSNVLAVVRSDGAVIAGGHSNLVSVAAPNGTVGGGHGNQIFGYGATISGGGGFDGISSGWAGNAAAGEYSAIGGGIGNGTSTNAYYATVGGGYFNLASNGSAVVAGGYQNVANGTASSIGGGYLNSAAGNYATVPGGIDSHANGTSSFAAGRGAVANHAGAFVLADSTAAYIASTVANQFTARASGGARFFSDANATIGVNLPAGGNSWAQVSDRNAKTDFQNIDADALLDRLNAMPVTSWRMRTQPDSIRHIGPTAQDFMDAFGLGESDTHINYSDAHGVSFAAIQALVKRLHSQESRNDALERRLESMEADLNTLKDDSPHAHTERVE